VVNFQILRVFHDTKHPYGGAEFSFDEEFDEEFFIKHFA